MIEKILIGAIGAALALALREVIEWLRTRKRRLNLASLMVTHLRQIHRDLDEHVQVKNGQANFKETQYWEIVVGDFLHQLFTGNIDVFLNVKSLEATVTFFHHYKVNMATVRSRLDASSNQTAQLTWQLA
ncbi:MAG: hypothetical protein OEM38_10455 [Gammaproteobacteria bacterium]|nr:hypothetical protein [Gammaproteobacteria bacterium]